MKSYLKLDRAAAVANCPEADLKLLCANDRLDCRQMGEEWFVAEDEIVETLSMMHREVLENELKELRQGTTEKALVKRTEETAVQLARSVAVVLIMLFGLAAAMAWAGFLSETGGWTAAVARFDRNVAAIVWGVE